MVIRHAAPWLLAATIAGGSLLAGCHHNRRCNDSCPQDDYQYGVAEGGVAYPTPADSNGYATGAPSTQQAGRVPFPRSGDVIYREPTLLERMKFGLQRMNPLSRREVRSDRLQPVKGPAEAGHYERPAPSAPAIQPVPEKRLPYTPAPAVGESVDARRAAKSLWPEGAPGSFDRARIDAGNANSSAAPRLLAQVDAWPYGPATSAAAQDGTPRFLCENGSGLSATPGEASAIRPVRVRNFH